MKKILIFILVVALVGLGGYWLFTKRKSEVKKYSGPLESVSLRLKWLHQAQFTGNYVAVERGFYGGQGLSVDLQPIDLKQSSIDALLASKVDFAIAGADEVLIAVSQGKPVKAVAVIYKLNPVVAYSLKSSGIVIPKDFVGKTVGLETGGNIEYLYRIMMNRAGITAKDVNEVTIGHDASELIEGTVDVATGYIINEPQLAIEKGYEVNTVLMADFGANMYADVLVTTDKTIEERPELVERFTWATLQGWKYAFENEDKAVIDVMKYAENSSELHQENMLKASVPLINTGTGRLGEMDQSSWERAQGLLFEQGLLSNKIDVMDAYTEEFTEKIYQKGL